MFKLALVITAIATSQAACAPAVQDKPPFTGIDYRLQSYVDDYCRIKYEVLQKPCRNIPMQVAALEKPTTLGTCSIKSNGTVRFIKIAPKVMEYSSYYSIREIVYHEMLHCDMGFMTHEDHRDSIMHAYHRWTSDAQSDMDLRKFFLRYVR